MIRRLYVDNFRSLVDFTWEPGKETLVLGYNGSGKTSALNVIHLLAQICARQSRLDLVITKEDRTNWNKADSITLEVDVELNRLLYRYRLVIGFTIDADWPDIVAEELFLDSHLILSRTKQRAQILDPTGTHGAHFPIISTQSVVSIVGSEFGGEAIIPFRDYLSRLIYLKPLPGEMSFQPYGPVQVPDESLGDIVSWYLFLSKNPEFVSTLVEDLKRIWSELIAIKTPEIVPGVHDLVLVVRGKEGASANVSLREMSDGEKILIGLYIVAAYQRTHPATTIVIDEPDNYVSLAELQPWLLTMLDERPDDGQLIIVSHNPRIIDTIGYESTSYFERGDHTSSTRVRRLSPDDTGLSLSSRISRGWIDE